MDQHGICFLILVCENALIVKSRNFVHVLLAYISLQNFLLLATGTHFDAWPAFYGLQFSYLVNILIYMANILVFNYITVNNLLSSSHFGISKYFRVQFYFPRML